jgi:hypothetical protein
VHFVTGSSFGLHGFGRFAGLPSEDLQQRSNKVAVLGVVPLLLQRLIDYGIATGYLRGRTVQRTSG